MVRQRQWGIKWMLSTGLEEYPGKLHTMWGRLFFRRSEGEECGHGEEDIYPVVWKHPKI